MRNRAAFILIIMCLYSSFSSAQISPGELSHVHENLEGINNCTKCHEQGEEITGKKCLDCHTEISEEISTRHGYHFQNSTSPCVNCHKEHLGKDADITQFDKKKFDHKQTGYPLSGKHASLVCESCHMQSKIKNPAVIKNQKSYPHDSYLGLRKQCIDCHTDEHANTLGSNCQNCHNENGWNEVSAFSHAKTKFPLLGKHEAVACKKCHESINIKEPSRPLLFSIKSYNDCNSCHKSPHGMDFSNQSCKSCHSPISWQSITGFDHSKTAFELMGKHKIVACEKCHAGLAGGEGKKMNIATKPFKDCTPCHSSPHSESFSQKLCLSCHNSQSWTSVKEQAFDHNLTTFPLKGKHVFLKCIECHKTEGKKTFKNKFKLAKQACSDCHNDVHKGEFVQKYNNNCSSCHTEIEFSPSTFTFDQHRTTNFALTNAHLTVSCRQCHLKGKELEFHFKNLQCKSCHNDQHNGEFTNLMKGKSCEVCHTTLSWEEMQFDHSITSFPLIGQHASVKCSKCHEKTYKGTSKDCADCHSDPHAGQFADKGRTNCALCHTPVSRRALVFRHNIQSTFALTGAHATVECGACHKPEMLDGRLVVRYKPLSSKCESCHQGDKL